jgi:RHS repeat-associated protein
MVLVTEYEYDDGAAGGDGNLTRQDQYLDAADRRTTSFGFDWRNRRVTSTGEEASFASVVYDNLNRQVRADRRQGNASGILVARSDTLYDTRGRVYRTLTYAVDPDTGEVGNALANNTWYDASGNPIKQQAAGSQLFTKTVYDGARRTVRVFQGFDADETAWADASSVADDTIVEQVQNVFDDAGNLLSMARAMRMHTAGEDQLGPLNDPSGPAPRARVTYQATWYDGVGRPIASADYGTNDGVPPLRPDVVPERSDTLLVGSLEYDARGQALKTIDPAGRQTRQFFDDAGRNVKTVRNYVDGLVDAGHADEDVTVETRFTPDGQLATLTARNPATGDQVTRYVYGTTLSDSAVARADLLRAEIYPDSDDTTDPLGDGPDGVYDRVQYTYNRQGQRLTKTDQNGTVHVYQYDGLMRLHQDCATVLGPGVDGAVRRIGVTYGVRGQPEEITSYTAPTPGEGGVVNQVQLVYNAFGLLVIDYQEHAGAVNVTSSPRVGYIYSDGNANHARRLGMIYPNGRVLLYDYDPGIDDALSRVTRICDDAGSGPGNPLVEYRRLGLNTFVQTDYPEPQLRCDLAHGPGDDPYAGLDRFGRIVDLRWWSNTSSADDIERIQHDYDRAGNRLWRRCPVATAAGKSFDELYTYDRVDQLVALDRGDLNAAQTGLVPGTKTFAEAWSLDMTGNWPQYRQDTDGDGTWDLDQSRTQNAANEILTIAGSSAHVSHDAAGNMTRIPSPLTGEGQGEGASHHTLTYDAWNRLVRVTDGATGQTLAEYDYDGRDHRVLKQAYSNGQLGEARHSYYTDQWQVVEDRLAAAETVDRHFVWGLRYVDDLVLRDRAPQDSGTLDERIYVLQDPNWNVTTIVASDGSAMERYSYSAYGRLVVLTGGLAPRASSLYAWESLFTARRLDNETSLYDYRMRIDSPGQGRLLSRDPLQADINLYRYCTNNPLTRTDPQGLDDTTSFPGQEVVWTGTIQHYYTYTDQWGRRQYSPPLWVDTVDKLRQWLQDQNTPSPPSAPPAQPTCNSEFVLDFLLGTGDSYRYYHPDGEMGRQMRQSPGAAKLRDAFYVNGCKNVTNFSYGHWEAARETGPLAPSHWGNVDFQVGGFGGATAVNNGDGTVTFTIRNEAGTRSFFAGFITGIPNRTCTTGPMRTIEQTFKWTEKIDRSKCCEKK